MIKKHVFLILALVFLTSCATYNEVNTPIAEINSYGVYKISSDTVSYIAENAATGYASLSEYETLLKETTEIPALKCISFGYKYEIRDFPESLDDKITMVVKHPLMKNYLGMKSNITRGDLPLELENGVYKDSIIYMMRHDYEVLQGEWELQILYRENILLTKTFNVYEAKQNERPNKAINCD